MEDDEMVPRSELERQLELARQEKEVAVFQAVDAVERKAKLQLNMRDIAMAKLAVVRNAAKETPDRPVKAVWEVADKARPPKEFLDQLAGLYGEQKESEVENEHLKTSQVQAEEHIGKNLTNQLHEARAGKNEDNTAHFDEAHAAALRGQEERIARLEERNTWLEQELEIAHAPNKEQEEESPETMPSTPMTADSMDFTMTATPFRSAPQSNQTNAVDKLKARQERFGTHPLSTTDLAHRTLSVDQARILIKNNKTVIDLVKAHTASRVAQQTADLMASVAQKDEELARLRGERDEPAVNLKNEIHANLCAENTCLNAQLTYMTKCRQTADSRISSIYQSVLQKPTQSVREAWGLAVRQITVPLLHRTKPSSEAIIFANNIITVNVDTPAKTFAVEQKLLCDASEFFKAATKGEWLEGQTKIVNLPDMTSPTFNIWLNWLYFHQVPLGTDDTRYCDWTNLISAYALGDRLMDGDYKDAVIDAMTVAMSTKDENGISYAPSQSHRSMLFRKTTADSTARRLVVSRMARVRHLLTEDDDRSLLFEVTKVTGKYRYEDTMKHAARCEFHEHKAGDLNCYRNKYNNVESVFSR